MHNTLSKHFYLPKKLHCIIRIVLMLSNLTIIVNLNNSYININIKIMNNMPNKTKKCINTSFRQKSSEYVKLCKIKLHTFNHGTFKQISKSSSITYSLTSLICKCMSLWALRITLIHFSVYLQWWALNN